MDISPSSSLSFHLSCSSNPHFPTMPLTTTNDTSSSSARNTIYFAYGSNLWRDQMRMRCPTSTHLGIARLEGYEWIIYERGYANIVEKKPQARVHEDQHDYTNEVWGLVYSLEISDEHRLDGNEGVPIAYKKEWIKCEHWPVETSHDNNSKDRAPDLEKEPKETEMLVYINRDSRQVGKIKDEYIHRMNKGIRDAVKEGMPSEYVKQVLRKFVPEKEKEDDEAKELASRQARKFVEARSREA
ncbi:hypothetical protein DOTSEDRAFT_71926 [Dothistroma septosporum NZE10]|uniref:gamma-glutamylcyclotransferase n=1 Tax=Dothistroma septosporum (strain NZE10 / CBS 128990) TaxID=675120 RepID=N1PP78_DOTSN|nr:hypothetical protein DOTSEDRAFT_71926 [Dothistroma septosporum NZE10]